MKALGGFCSHSSLWLTTSSTTPPAPARRITRELGDLLLPWATPEKATATPLFTVMSYSKDRWASTNFKGNKLKIIKNWADNPKENF